VSLRQQSSPSSTPHPPGPLPRGAVVVVLLALTLGVAHLRFAAPAPLGADAPADQFSAARALAQLSVLLGDERPHPVGSPANAAVRDRILARLRALGYEPEVQSGSSCGRWGRCATVDNIVATIPGGPAAVMLVAHYDSVPAGPGAADDGAAVGAMLEIARILAAAPPPRNTIVLLIDDGEEVGLLGAELFMAQHPLAKQVQVVINLEARGTSGPSLMFETAGPTAELARLFGASVSRPISSSLFAAVYEQLPNDTDLTVFRDHGLAGYNFAFIDDARHYHTAQDDLAHLSAASVQHHGDNALALVRALGQADLAAVRAAGPAVWFDVLGWFLVRWPLGWSLPLAGFCALVVVGATVLAARRRSGLLRGGLICLAAGLATLLLVGLVSALLVWLLAAVGLVAQFGVGSTPVLVGVPLAVALAAGVFVPRVGPLRRQPPGAWYAGVWFLWALLMIAVAVALPAGSYLFIVPVAFAGLAAPAAHGLARSRRWLARVAPLLPMVVAALLWLTVVLALVSALGLAGQVVIGLAVALTVTTALPALGPPRKPDVPAG